MIIAVQCQSGGPMSNDDDDDDDEDDDDVVDANVFVLPMLMIMLKLLLQVLHMPTVEKCFEQDHEFHLGKTTYIVDFIARL